MNSGIPVRMCLEKNRRAAEVGAISSPSFSSFLG